MTDGSNLTAAPGDIGLVSIRGHLGLFIRIGQWLCGDGWGHYEHAFVYVGNGRVVEAMPSGARVAPITRYAGMLVLWLRCPPVLGQGVAAAAVTFVSTPYSFADYLAIALHRLRIPTPFLRRYIEWSGRLICSQLADRAAEYGGWHLFDDGRWHGYVTPGALRRLAERQNSRVTPGSGTPA